MKIDTITIIASGVLLTAAILLLYSGHLRRRHHVRRRLVMDLLRNFRPRRCVPVSGPIRVR